MALDWLPIAPAWLPTPKRRVGAEPLVRFYALPIPNPAPPTELTWHPSYPDRLDARRWLRVATQPTRTGFIGPPISDLRWLPTYPARLVRLRLPVADYPATFSFSLGALQGVATQGGGWRPTYPAWLNRKLPVRTGTSIWLVDPTTLLNAASCVEWTTETCTLPRFTSEVRTNPDFTSETCTLPSMTGEDLC